MRFKVRSSPTPPTPTVVTASVYILPNTVSLNDCAFGDEPVVIHKSERLRDVAPVLVRIVSELAERVSGNRLDGLGGRLPPTTMVAGIETGARAACRHRALRHPSEGRRIRGVPPT